MSLINTMRGTRVFLVAFAVALAFFSGACAGDTERIPSAPSPTPTTVPAGTPWSELPPLSDEARRIVIEHNINSNFLQGNRPAGVINWGGVQARIWADENFIQEDVQWAIDLYTTKTGGGYRSPARLDQVGSNRPLEFGMASILSGGRGCLRYSRPKVTCWEQGDVWLRQLRFHGKANLSEPSAASSGDHRPRVQSCARSYWQQSARRACPDWGCGQSLSDARSLVTDRGSPQVDCFCASGHQADLARSFSGALKVKLESSSRVV